MPYGIHDQGYRKGGNIIYNNSIPADANTQGTGMPYGTPRAIARKGGQALCKFQTKYLGW